MSDPAEPTATEAHAQLLVAAARGDDAALATLVELYHARVYRFGQRVCRDDFDADDAVQEAFVKLSGRPDVIADRGALAWLMTVVKRACLRLLRPFARERRALGERVDASADGRDDGLRAADDGPDVRIERRELVHAVQAAIAALDTPYREVLVMRDLEGLSGEETCEALGLPLAAMKTRLHRARGMLRKQLEATAATSQR